MRGIAFLEVLAKVVTFCGAGKIGTADWFYCISPLRCFQLEQGVGQANRQEISPRRGALNDASMGERGPTLASGARAALDWQFARTHQNGGAAWISV